MLQESLSAFRGRITLRGVYQIVPSSGSRCLGSFRQMEKGKGKWSRRSFVSCAAPGKHLWGTDLPKNLSLSLPLPHPTPRHPTSHRLWNPDGQGDKPVSSWFPWWLPGKLIGITSLPACLLTVEEFSKPDSAGICT